MTVEQSMPKYVSLFALLLAALSLAPRAKAQAMTMDGESGIFFQPMAEIVPSPQHKFSGPTFGLHGVGAGPVAGNYINLGVEEGFGDRLEFGFTRDFHTDGGDPTISPLVNFRGMNIFNFKVKVLASDYRGHKYLPTLSLGGVLRTNDPYMVQAVTHKNQTNGDVYLVGTKLIMIGKKFGFVANAGVRGTNAQKYGYGGNAVDWEARGFGALVLPIPIEKVVLISPTVEVDQEPKRLEYFPPATIPTDLIYAVRLSRLPDSRWSLDIGTGHIGGNLAPGINIKVDRAVAIAVHYRFSGYRER